MLPQNAKHLLVNAERTSDHAHITALVTSQTVKKLTTKMRVTKSMRMTVIVTVKAKLKISK